jgi:hypothetical protein
VSFDDFCELILPYRIKNEPLENWKDSYYNRFQPLLDSLLTDKSDALEAVRVTLYTITKESDMCWATIDLPESTAYRYIRYLSGDEGYCNMAEVQLIDANGKKLKGKVIGTESSYQNKADNNRLAVFDGAPLTFFDALESDDAWAGLDLGETKDIRQIRYISRNDDNNIRIGDTYFYRIVKFIFLCKSPFFDKKTVILQCCFDTLNCFFCFLFFR